MTEREAAKAEMQEHSEKFLSAIQGKYNAVVLLLDEETNLSFATNIPKDMAARLMGITAMNIMEEQMPLDEDVTVQ